MKGFVTDVANIRGRQLGTRRRDLDSGANRQQVRDGAAILMALVPAFVDI